MARIKQAEKKRARKEMKSMLKYACWRHFLPGLEAERAQELPVSRARDKIALPLQA
jgi:hypothetical protein